VRIHLWTALTAIHHQDDRNSSQAVKCLMLRIKPGLSSLMAARAMASIAVKLRQACMATCSRPLSLMQPSSSHSFAWLNSLSTLQRPLNSSTRRRAPRVTKSLPTLRAFLTLESLLTGITGSASNARAVSLTLFELYWASASTVLNFMPRPCTRSSSGLK